MTRRSASSAANRSFASLARHISGWTTNLLATAIVLALGLTLGSQVIAWWRDEPLNATPQKAAVAYAALPTVGEDHEFWTRGGLLELQRVSGGSSDAIAAMRAFCRAALPAEQPAPAGAGEAQFVAQLAQQDPLEETADVRLYQPMGQTAMVVAVSRHTQRIVGWSFALPDEKGAWSLFHFRPAAAQSSQPHPLQSTLHE